MSRPRAKARKKARAHWLLASLLELFMLLVRLYVFVFQVAFFVLYILGMKAYESITHKPASQPQPDMARASTQTATAEPSMTIEEIANNDVADALDIEVESLRNYREKLLERSRQTNVSATQSAKLQKQAATTYTQMMKLNEQALKRRNR